MLGRQHHVVLLFLLFRKGRNFYTQHFPVILSAAAAVCDGKRVSHGMLLVRNLTKVLASAILTHIISNEYALMRLQMPVSSSFTMLQMSCCNQNRLSNKPAMWLLLPEELQMLLSLLNCCLLSKCITETRNAASALQSHHLLHVQASMHKVPEACKSCAHLIASLCLPGHNYKVLILSELQCSSVCASDKTPNHDHSV